LNVDITPARTVLEYLNSIGTVGLALIVWALWTRRLITRGEFDLLTQRELDLQQRLDKALNIGGRATETSQVLVDSLPPAMKS